MLSFIPFAEIGYKIYWDREITSTDVRLEVAGIIPLAKIARRGKTILNFSDAAAKHMDEVGRYVPVQILDDVIRTTKGTPDPKKTRALMHSTEMTRNGKTYKLEILYDKQTNSVWHFKYSPIK